MERHVGAMPRSCEPDTAPSLRESEAVEDPIAPSIGIGRVVRYEVQNLTADNCPCRKSRLCDCYAKCNIIVW